MARGRPGRPGPPSPSTTQAMQSRAKRGHSLRFGATVVVALLLLASTLVASAATLGGIRSADLFAWSATSTIPLPLAFDHFDDCSGNLDGDSPVTGGGWLAPSGDWRCQRNQSRARNRNQNTTDTATIDVDRSDELVVSAFLQRTSRTAGGGSGLSLFHDPGTGHHMYVIYQRGADRVILGKVDGSGDSEIASVTWLPRSNTIELLVEIDQPSITVYADGSLLGTYTMGAGEVATFGANSRFGLESDLDRRSQWAWFEVEDLTP